MMGDWKCYLGRSSRHTKTVRRSVALPREIVEAASRAASPELRHNLNRLVIVALEEFIARRRLNEFEAAMEQMAADGAIRSESRRVGEEFAVAESDGF